MKRFYALYQTKPDSSLAKDFHGVEFEAVDQDHAKAIAKAFSHHGHILFGNVNPMQKSPVAPGYELAPN